MPSSERTVNSPRGSVGRSAGRAAGARCRCSCDAGRALERERQRLLRLPGQRHPPGPVSGPWCASARRSARAEALLDPALDLVQVDADRGQRLGVVAGRLALNAVRSRSTESTPRLASARAATPSRTPARTACTPGGSGRRARWPWPSQITTVLALSVNRSNMSLPVPRRRGARASCVRPAGIRRGSPRSPARTSRVPVRCRPGALRVAPAACGGRRRPGVRCAGPSCRPPPPRRVRCPCCQSMLTLTSCQPKLTWFRGPITKRLQEAAEPCRIALRSHN